jgi:hypothetical protein
LGFHCGKGARRVQGGQNRDVAAAHKMSAAHFRNVSTCRSSYHRG